MAEELTEVAVRPGSGILAVLSHLPYKPWYALAEFVDNSLQSMLANRERLVAEEGKDYQLKVEIIIDAAASTITIRDNASGIGTEDYRRAFKPAQPPADRTGLSEFGMGMKTAACWFANRWQVRTSALGEDVTRILTMDIDEIKARDAETIQVRSEPARPGAHFTEVILECDPHKIPQKKTLGKVRSHLKSMYRRFLNDGRMVLIVADEQLVYEKPSVLVIPKVDRDGIPREGEDVRWEREFLFEFGDNCIASVTAGILETGDTKGAGFAIFRRDRLIVGSGDETYRPERICGNQNSHAAQRIFGEIDLAGVEVAHTKDGFQWNDWEDEFIEKLREQLDDPEFPIRYQAETYRPRLLRSQLNQQVTVQERASETTGQIQHSLEARVLPNIEGAAKGNDTTVAPDEMPTIPQVFTRKFRASYNDLSYDIEVEVVADDGNSSMIELLQGRDDETRKLRYRLNLNHPFVRQHMGPFQENLDLFLQLASGVAVAENVAAQYPTLQAAKMRRYLGQILKDILPV